MQEYPEKNSWFRRTLPKTAQLCGPAYFFGCGGTV